MQRAEPVAASGNYNQSRNGGAHHTAFSYDLSVQQRVDAMGIESVAINKDTAIPALKNGLRWNACCYK